jgi:hypothetical protein
MSGTQTAERTCCITIDCPVNRASSPALSVRIATLSSSALRAIDLGISPAVFVPLRSRANFGCRLPRSSTRMIATRSTSRI